MKTLLGSTAFALAFLAALPAEAAPRLSGSYTVAGTETCQVVFEGGLPGLGGRIEQHLGTLVVTPTSTGATGRLATRNLGGNLITRDRSIRRIDRGMDVTLVVSGTTSPFDFTMIEKTPKLTRRLTGLIQFDQISAGIAQRAVVVAVHPAENAAHSDCAVQMTFVHR